MHYEIHQHGIHIAISKQNKYEENEKLCFIQSIMPTNIPLYRKKQ